jgi:hypothetical protein
VTAGSLTAGLTVWLHLAATLVMVGVIWYVQLVHYPLMARVNPASFPEFHREHARRTGWVVIGPMLAEAATAVVLVVPGVDAVPRPVAAVGLVLVLALWTSTFAVQVPLHGRLARGFDSVTHRRLVLTNWARTAGWSVRGVLALLMTASVI